MKVFHSDRFVVPLPGDHRFPMAKYGLLRRAVEASRLLREGELEEPVAATDAEILRVHRPDYLTRVTNGVLTRQEMRRIGFPWSRELVERSRRSVGGTLGACRSALVDGLAVNLAGGTHHAFADRGEGYCVFNDVAIAARAVQAEERVERIVVVDCDVHQGNGTAAIFRGDPSVFTFSIHGRNNFPFRKEISDIDVALADGVGDGDYLEALERGLRQALAASRAELAVYVAGADAYAGDRLGRLALSRAGLAARDRMVLDHCRRAGIAVAVVMGGGYAADVEAIVEIHLQTVRAAVELARVAERAPWYTMSKGEQRPPRLAPAAVAEGG